MSLRCVVERAVQSQNDIVSDRPSGSSCCTLFCSRVALSVLRLLRLPASTGESALTMPALKALLIQAVRDWDTTGLVDGAEAHTVLTSSCEGAELEVLVQEHFVARAALQQMLSESDVKAVLVTAIPMSAEGEAQQRTGKTFLIVSLPKAIYLVDSHSHHPFKAVPSGMLRACLKSTCASKRAHVLCDWIWDDNGFLMELQCDRQLVDITAFRNKAAGAPSVSGNGAASSQEAASSPGSCRPVRQGGAVPVSCLRAVAGQDASSAAVGAASSHGDTCSAPRAPGAADLGTSSGAHWPLVVISNSALASSVGAPENHEVAHPAFVKNCPRCRWRRTGPIWQRRHAFHHPVTGQLTSPIAEKPPGMSGTWGVGCSVCANYLAQTGGTHRRKKGAFALFQVNTLTTLQGMEISRHCKSAFHIQAMAALRVVAIANLQPEATTEVDATGVSTSCMEDVPRPEKFVWAVTNCHAAGSYRDFQQFCESAELTSLLASGRNKTDSGRNTCMQLITAWGAVLSDEHRSVLSKGQRLSFSFDERDQVLVNRVRIVVCNPVVKAHEFVAGVIRDFGHSIDECADAAWESLKAMCVKFVGRRGPDGVTGPQDAACSQLLERLQAITFAGSSDGAEVAIQGIQKLRTSGRLPNLRYQFRDRPHTTRTCVKNTLSYMGEGQELLDALVSGQHSFCKRVKYSRRFQQLWKKRQQADAASSQHVEEFVQVLENLSYKECRFDHRSEPMSILCMKFRAVVGVLVELQADHKDHPADAAWAKGLLRLISGADGFNKLLKFGVDCDFAVAAGLLIRLQDKPSADISLSVSEVTECLEICHVLFREGRAFDLQDNHTYTGHLLRGFLRDSSAASSQSAASNQGGIKSFKELNIGWPTECSQEEAMAEGRRYARTLYQMAYKFMKLNYPDYNWRTKFGAFNCGPSAFPEAYRLDCLEKLAVKEGLDKAQTRWQFQQVFPHMKRLYRESDDNRQAWCKLLESVRSKDSPRKFRPDMASVVQLTLTYIGILDVTTDVERAFARIQRLEIKSRERHCHPSRLQDSLNVLLEVPSCVDALVTRTPEATRQNSSAPLLQVMWRPRLLLAKAQRKYAEFFGTKKLVCRSMEPLSLVARAKELRVRAIKISKPCGLQPGASPCKSGAPRKVPKIEMRRRWTSHVKGLVTGLKTRGGLQRSTRSPGYTARQKRAFTALAARKGRDRSEFQKAEKTTGLVRPVKPLRTVAKAKARGVKRSAASAAQSVWFESGQVAKASKLDVAVSQDKISAQILVVDDYKKCLKGGVASLHCRLHGKILAGKDAKITGGKLTGQHTSFRKPTQQILVYASSAVTKKHNSMMKELQSAPCVKFMTSEDSMLVACKNTAFSQIRWLGVKAELAAFAQRLQAAKLSSSHAVVCTATHFVECVGAVS